MAEIRSRATLEQIIRKGIFVAMVVVFGAYFAYDGYIGYPRKNLDQIRKSNPGLVPLETPPINWNVTVENTRRVEDQKPTSLARVKEELGPPDYQSDDGLSSYWFGPAAVMKVTTTGKDLIPRGNIEQMIAAYKSELDIRTQKVLALVLAVIGVPLVVHYLRVLAYCVRLDEQGLKISGKPLIPFEAMTGLDASRYRDKGWIRLRYRRGGQEAAVRMDDYWIKDFNALIQALCERKSFENPLESEAAESDAVPSTHEDEA